MQEAVFRGVFHGVYTYIDVIGVNYHFFFILKLVTAEEIPSILVTTFKPIHTKNKLQGISHENTWTPNFQWPQTATHALLRHVPDVCPLRAQPARHVNHGSSFSRPGWDSVFSIWFYQQTQHISCSHIMMKIWICGRTLFGALKQRGFSKMLHSFPCIPITSSLALTKVDTHWELPISAESFRRATNYYQLFALIGLNTENPWVSQQQYGNWWKKSCEQAFLCFPVIYRFYYLHFTVSYIPVDQSDWTAISQYEHHGS